MPDFAYIIIFEIKLMLSTKDEAYSTNHLKQRGPATKGCFFQGPSAISIPEVVKRVFIISIKPR